MKIETGITAGKFVTTYDRSSFNCPKPQYIDWSQCWFDTGDGQYCDKVMESCGFIYQG